MTARRTGTTLPLVSASSPAQTERPFVDRLHIQNYGCIQNLTLRLTPLHALIGPNDSGKSTVLRALRTLTVLGGGHGDELVSQESALLEKALFGGRRDPPAVLEASSHELGWRIVGASPAKAAHQQLLRHRSRGGEPQWVSQAEHPLNFRSGSHLLRTPQPGPLSAALGGSVLLRLDPDALRAPTSLLPEGAPMRFSDDRGTGLPAIYDAIVVRDIEAYLRVNERFRELFPTVKNLSPKNVSAHQKALGVTLQNGTFVPADLVSEGMLYYLAFAALPHLEPTAVLLVEEPENGLHPARIKEVMGLLRELSGTMQVLLATHSPLVVNELGGDEVTVLTRSPETGTRGTLLSETPRYQERSKVYETGELWVSYANGVDEGPLLRGEPREVGE